MTDHVKPYVDRLRGIYTDEGFTGVLAAVNRFRYHHVGNVTEPLSQLWYRPEAPTVDLMSEDWDTVVVLDACRYDLYCETIETVDKRSSPASQTRVWLTATFPDTYPDTVYVTANPMYRKLDMTETFHDVVDVWLSDWNDDLGTVHPRAVTRRAIDTHETYPNKRIVVHYIQPHHPMLTAPIDDVPGFTFIVDEVAGIERHEHKRPTIWERVESGDVSRFDAWRWYRENLELVREHVEDLVIEIDGRVVVTSDHGNMTGERAHPFLGPRIYAHPAGIAHRHLRTVPWDVVQKGRRPRIEADGIQPLDDVSDTVGDRLVHLGYARDL